MVAESKFPTLVVSSISSLDQDRIVSIYSTFLKALLLLSFVMQQFLCGVESVPGVTVTCVNELGEKILCHVQVEWIYATVSG